MKGKERLIHPKWGPIIKGKWERIKKKKGKERKMKGDNVDSRVMINGATHAQFK